MYLNDCDICYIHWIANPGLREACASVGIERGKSTDQMLREYFSEFHENRHGKE